MIIFALIAVLWSTLAQSPAEQTVTTTPDQPPFYDEPQFVVSGVRDYTYRGGHGSDSVLRSTEALTASALSLRDATANSMSLSVAAARGTALREKLAHEPFNADLFHELADVEQRLCHPVDAVHDFQRAAELKPSEANLFDWGAELLEYRAGDPAIRVFEKGTQRFPQSTRLRLGLAVALYLQGEYDRAANEFFAATDSNPHDSLPYTFLARVQAREITESAGYLERVRRFANLEPKKAWAAYYYAACLWDRRDASTAKAFAQRATELNPKIDVAYLLLGTIATEQRDFLEAIRMLTKAVQINPELIEAHYRLAQAYVASGQKSRAQDERTTYRQLSDRAAQKRETERKQIQQFVITSEK